MMKSLGGESKVEDVESEIQKDQGSLSTSPTTQSTHLIGLMNILPLGYTLSAFLLLALQYLANPPKLPQNAAGSLKHVRSVVTRDLQNRSPSSCVS